MIEKFMITHSFQSVLPLKLSLRGWALCILRIKGSHQISMSKADSSSNYLTFDNISTKLPEYRSILTKNYYMSLNKDNCDQDKLLTFNVYQPCQQRLSQATTPSMNSGHNWQCMAREHPFEGNYGASTNTQIETAMKANSRKCQTAHARPLLESAGLS